MMGGVDAVVENLPAVFAGGFGVGGGLVFAKWFLEWVGGRVDKREAAVTAAMARVDTGTATLIDHLQSQITWCTTTIAGLRNDLSHCQEQHVETLEDLARLKGVVQGLDDARQTAQVIVAADKLSKGA